MWNYVIREGLLGEEKVYNCVMFTTYDAFEEVAKKVKKSVAMDQEMEAIERNET